MKGERDTKAKKSIIEKIVYFLRGLKNALLSFFGFNKTESSNEPPNKPPKGPIQQARTGRIEKGSSMPQPNTEQEGGQTLTQNAGGSDAGEQRGADAVSRTAKGAMTAVDEPVDAQQARTGRIEKGSWKPQLDPITEELEGEDQALTQDAGGSDAREQRGADAVSRTAEVAMPAVDESVDAQQARTGRIEKGSWKPQLDPITEELGEGDQTLTQNAGGSDAREQRGADAVSRTAEEAMPAVGGSGVEVAAVQETKVTYPAFDEQELSSRIGNEESIKQRVYIALKLFAEARGRFSGEELLEQYAGLNKPGRSGKGAINTLFGDRALKSDVTKQLKSAKLKEACHQIEKVLGVETDTIDYAFLEGMCAKEPAKLIKVIKAVGNAHTDTIASEESSRLDAQQARTGPIKQESSRPQPDTEQEGDQTLTQNAGGSDAGEQRGADAVSRTAEVAMPAVDESVDAQQARTGRIEKGSWKPQLDPITEELGEEDQTLTQNAGGSDAREQRGADAVSRTAKGAMTAEDESVDAQQTRPGPIEQESSMPQPIENIGGSVPGEQRGADVVTRTAEEAMPAVGGSGVEVAAVQETKVTYPAFDEQELSSRIGNEESIKQRVYIALKLFAEARGRFSGEELLEQYAGLNKPGRSGKGAINTLFGDRALKSDVTKQLKSAKLKEACHQIEKVLGVETDTIDYAFLEGMCAKEPVKLIKVIKAVSNAHTDTIASEESSRLDEQQPSTDVVTSTAEEAMPAVGGSGVEVAAVQETKATRPAFDEQELSSRIGNEESIKQRVYIALKLFAEARGRFSGEELLEQYAGLNKPGRSGKGAINTLFGDRALKSDVTKQLKSAKLKEACHQIEKVLGVETDTIDYAFLEGMCAKEPAKLIKVIKAVGNAHTDTIASEESSRLDEQQPSTDVVTSTAEEAMPAVGGSGVEVAAVQETKVTYPAFDEQELSSRIGNEESIKQRVYIALKLFAEARGRFSGEELLEQYAGLNKPGRSGKGAINTLFGDRALKSDVTKQLKSAKLKEACHQIEKVLGVETDTIDYAFLEGMCAKEPAKLIKVIKAVGNAHTDTIASEESSRLDEQQPSTDVVTSTAEEAMPAVGGSGVEVAAVQETKATRPAFDEQELKSRIGNEESIKQRVYIALELFAEARRDLLGKSLGQVYKGLNVPKGKGAINTLFGDSALKSGVTKQLKSAKLKEACHQIATVLDASDDKISYGFLEQLQTDKPQELVDAINKVAGSASSSK